MGKVIHDYMKSRLWQVLLLLVLQCVQAALMLYLPNLNADIINEGVASGQESQIWHYGWQMLGLSVIQVIVAIAATWSASRVATDIAYELRRDYFGAVEQFSLQEVEHFSAGSLITRATNDVQQVQMMLFQGLNIVLQAPIMFIGGIILASRQDGPLTWTLAVIIPIIIIVAGALMGTMGPLFKKLQARLDTLNLIIREQITGVRVIRAFTREATEAQRFGEANDRMRTVMVAVGRLMSLMMPLMMLIMNISNIAIMWFGAHRIDSGGMPIGNLQAFIQYLMMILISLMMASMMMVMLPRAVVSAKRVVEVRDTPCAIQAPEQPYHPTDPKGVIEFKHVSFQYPGAQDPVLDDLSFTIAPGTTTAIIGSTGSGKSSIIRVAQRMFDVSQGQVLVDGHDVREYDPHELASLFGTVPQRSLLFSGTIASNLKFGNPHATEEDMWQALRIAQAEDFVRELPEGLDAPVAQGGTNFSGGQRQRLCIARAIMRKPAVFTFDDSFSALDFATDKALRTALKPITRQTSVIIVAQRISTVMDADTIIVMDNGRMVGIGKHQELLANCPTYRQIADSQLNQEEQ
ncbi:multidrug ABC transporter ATP-binding protein [Galliscardovia ingluviei]|uniref:Multidrug ABC transporter ATP-binding protein n=1 Tax=Galliscardovia ingluviei TaxID=1769422 RepID=A0A8J3AHL4_9BIFI|nr:ABC transporter ATP-binding protein [Galliscardovia ingluviei]GGI13478.1 multidrug ABC transporter ATP-binding protein [Galliscardovia ingluviei]